MTSAKLILATRTALDIDTARRLTDYGDLDDAGVARALEQVYMQRWGCADLPGHLRRIEALAAIVDDGTELRLIQPGSVDESARLVDLFAAWPSVATDLIDWGGSEHGLLTARALANEIVLPPTFFEGATCALAELVAPACLGHTVPTAQVEQECLWLMGGLEPNANMVTRVVARYRLWLRWQYCRGCIDAGTRAARETRLSELLLTDTYEPTA